MSESRSAVTGIDLLERRVAANDRDARSMYELAVLLDDQRENLRGADFTPARHRAALERVRALLMRVIELQPRHPRAHALLGYTLYMQEEHEKALAAFAVARKLSPRRFSLDAYVADVLATLGRNAAFRREIASMAKRQKVDLRAHRAEIARTGWDETPDVLLQAFIPRNRLASELADEAERIRNSLVKGRKAALAKAERDECARRQKELKQSFRAERVPKELRSLAPAASRYGVGDDPCRSLIMKRVPKASRARLIRAADKLAEKVQVWLDSFGGGDRMSWEAAAFMYLYEAIEEVRR